MSEPGAVEALASAPLFEGVRREDVVEVARLMRRRVVEAGDVLWHQGAEAQGMALVVEGRVAVQLRLPGGRFVDLADAGPGETMGELPLIDGSPHSATARVTEAGSVLLLARGDFAAFATRETPSAFALQRRLALVTAARLRRQLELLGASLGPDGPDRAAADAARTLEGLAEADPPDPAYVQRMATFRAADPSALDGFLAAGRYVRCGRGHTLEEEGGNAAAFYLVVNGTVERVLVRGDRRIRLGLAGPGQAFGYEGLLDGRPSPATAVARERALLLALPGAAFSQLFAGGGAASRTVLGVVNRDLAAWLRRVVRPQAHLAVRPIA